MSILVSDTSVIIDLERGLLLDHLFRLPFEFAVPDLLFHRELEGPVGKRLVALGLRIEELTPVELARATAARRSRSDLSIADTFAFALAASRGWALLTGDGGLRSLAIDEKLDVHGVLWIFDQFEQGRQLALSELHISLTAISSHPRCRLPTAEIRRLLARYSSE